MPLKEGGSLGIARDVAFASSFQVADTNIPIAYGLSPGTLWGL